MRGRGGIPVMPQHRHIEALSGKGLWTHRQRRRIGAGNRKPAGQGRDRRQRLQHQGDGEEMRRRHDAAAAQPGRLQRGIHEAGEFAMPQWHDMRQPNKIRLCDGRGQPQPAAVEQTGILPSSNRTWRFCHGCALGNRPGARVRATSISASRIGPAKHLTFAPSSLPGYSGLTEAGFLNTDIAAAAVFPPPATRWSTCVRLKKYLV